MDLKNLIEMVEIPGGSFLMGSPDSEKGRRPDEGPQRLVTVPTFRAGKYPVTQAQWVAVMGTNPSHFKGKNLPVERISWFDAQEFCRRLGELTGDHYRLLTEAEWEYICRAESPTAYHFGDESAKLGEYAWFSENSDNRTHPVGRKKPNPFGLYDMHGNVWEWCKDVWHVNYDGAPNDRSAWNGDDERRVLRGGSWSNPSILCRSANRCLYVHGDHSITIGMRVAVGGEKYE